MTTKLKSCAHNMLCALRVQDLGSGYRLNTEKGGFLSYKDAYAIYALYGINSDFRGVI